MAGAAEAERAEAFKAMERELHDLCQPLTTLQCRLELAQMNADEASLREAVAGGLGETERLFAGIRKLREHLMRELQQVNRDQL